MSRRPKKQQAVKTTPYYASEELYQALFEQAADGIFIADVQGCFIEVNRRGCEMLGYTREELLDLSIEDLIPAEDLAAENIRRRIEGEEETIHYDFRGLRKDGSMIDIEVYARPIEYGGEMGVIGTLVDITERKQAEKALRTSEERLQLALDAAQMGQWDWNIVTGEVMWSPQCLALYGLPPDTPMSYERFLQALHPEDRERIDAALRQAVEDRAGYDEQKRAVWPDGSVHWTASRGRVYCDAAGQPVRMIGVTFDITKWKEAEEALRGALAELTVIHQNAPIAMMLLDRDRRVRKVNQAAALFAGRPGEEMLGLRSGEALRCLHHLDDPQGCGFGPACATCAVRLAALDTFATHESKRDIEVWMPFPQGDSVEERCLLMSTAYLQLDDAERVLVCTQDITDHKRAEEEIRAGEARFRTLVNHAADAFFLHDDDEQGTILDVNHQACESLGYSREELIGLTVYDFDAGLDHSFVAQIGAPLDAGEVIAFDTLHRRKDGSVFPVEVRIRPFRQGERRLAVSLARDITERKRMEEALAAQEREFRTLAENSPDNIARYDVNCRTLYVNPTLEKTLGRPASEILGTTPIEVALIDEAPKYQEKIAEVLKTGKDDEMDLISPDRREGVRYHNIRFVAERGADGTITGVQTIGRDITERKQAEVERQAHIRFLESMDRVNRAIQGTNDLDQMMGDVLDVVLAIFDSDRAWLNYPCDPETDVVQVPMERTKPEYPGAFALGTELTVTPAFAAAIQTALDSSGPVGYGPGNEHPLQTSMAKHSGIQSLLVMVIYPKIEKPWMFGLHQCAYSRVWTPEERRLFQEIGRRLTDALTSLLAYRHLQESEERYRLIAENTADTISVFDLNLKPIYVSPSVLKLRGYTVEEAMTQALDQVLTPESLQKVKKVFVKQLALEASGKADLARTVLLELEQYRKDGSTIWVELTASIIRDDNLQPTGILTVSRDITERQQTQEALRASEARFRIFVDHAADPFYLHDAQGTILDVNRQACESLGYSREELIGMNPYDFDAGVDRSFIDQINARLDTGEMLAFDTQHRRKDGTVFPVEVRARPFWQGERRFSVSLVRDISERKRAEESLILFRSLIDHANDIIEVADPETGRYLDMNERACLAHGYTREEYLTLTVPQINAVMAGRSWQKTVEELRRSGSFVRESQHRRKDGSTFPVEININYIRLDRDYLLSVVRDITERKRAEEALRESEERLRQIASSLREVVWLRDVQTRQVLYVNPAFQELTGRTCENFYENRDIVIDAIHPDDKEGVIKALDQRCESVPFDKEHRIIHLDGSVRWVSSRSFPVRNEAGEVYRWASIMEDITERKQLEAENEQLTAQFYQAQKIEAIGRLAGGIAHDFNNLLVPIIGYIDLNLMDLSPESELYADLTQVRKAADRAADLTRQILAFSRQQVLELSILDLNMIIDEFKKMLQRLIGEDVELQTFLSPALYPVKADIGQIEQVLMNLAINSRDAMPAGGKLTIETANVFLDETYVKKYASELVSGHYVMLAVSDTGQGMDAETQKRIFDPFFTTKESGKGTGLGLSTVFGIIKQHQGHIGVYSEPGQGTTFKIYLPKAKKTRQTTIPTTKESVSIYGTETVLVAEDDEMVRKLVCETLEAHGYDVIEAQSPADCLELASGKDTIHLLLTDVIMPDMNGKELYQKLIAIHPNSRVLYMSGYTNNVIVHHSILDEGINFLQKPFTVYNLTRKVREVLD